MIAEKEVDSTPEGVQKSHKKIESVQNITGVSGKGAPTYIVDAESGPYKSIQEAIDAAEPHSRIKLAAGLYSDNLVISKPGLIIEPKEKEGDIILVVSSRPAITIRLENNE